jgi:hypothetical protein
MDVSREINPFAYLNYIVFDENFFLAELLVSRTLLE